MQELPVQALAPGSWSSLFASARDTVHVPSINPLAPILRCSI